MKKDYKLFNFQQILEQQKEKHAGNELFEKLMEGIDENSVVEDLPFYKDYLARFDVEKAFDGINLATEEKIQLSRDELYLLFRLIFASFSSTYEILYDKPTNSVDVSISVKTSEQMITKNVAELWTFQIDRMFEIYMNELFELNISELDAEEQEHFETEQKVRLMIFEKKVRKMNQQIRDLQEADEILSDLDDLLNS